MTDTVRAAGPRMILHLRIRTQSKDPSALDVVSKKVVQPLERGLMADG